MCCTKLSSVINTIFSGHLLFSYTQKGSFADLHLKYNLSHYINTIKNDLQTRGAQEKKEVASNSCNKISRVI